MEKVDSQGHPIEIGDVITWACTSEFGEVVEFMETEVTRSQLVRRRVYADDGSYTIPWVYEDRTEPAFMAVVVNCGTLQLILLENTTFREKAERPMGPAFKAMLSRLVQS